MPHLLKNELLEIQIDNPLENYNFSRFDWTGKIRTVKFKNTPLTTVENIDNQQESILGQGFYNEFGIDTALGFEEAKVGEWFHKIGVGLLKKTNSAYAFNEKYEISPAIFTVKEALNKLLITCQSKLVNGFAYQLTKTISLQEGSLSIHYALKNTGNKTIITDEYVHNFININQSNISPSYQLKFPFRLQPHRFIETVNPEKKVDIHSKGFGFNGLPNEPFFFSNLSGHKAVKAVWELQHLTHGIAIRESGNFKTNKINLWGWQHVISPELFYKINIAAGQSTSWIRKYEFYVLNN